MSNTPISVLPVIMAGGSGTRLWPLSRAGFPKQFLVLSGDDSLFQQAAQRLARLAADDLALSPLLVVGNAEHRFLALEQLREIRQEPGAVLLDRKSTRLNSSHSQQSRMPSSA